VETVPKSNLLGPQCGRHRGGRGVAGLPPLLPRAPWAPRSACGRASLTVNGRPLRCAGDGPRALSVPVLSVWRSQDRRTCGRVMRQQDNRDKVAGYSRVRSLSTIFLWTQISEESCPW